MDYQDSEHFPQDNSPANNSQTDDAFSNNTASDQVQDAQFIDQETSGIDSGFSGQTDSGINEFVDMIGLDLDEQDPVSAFNHRDKSRENERSQGLSSFDEDALEAEVIEEGNDMSLNEDFNPEKNRTIVNFSANGLVKGVIVMGGILALISGGTAFYNGQMPKGKVANIQKTKNPADEKVNAAESAATKAQQSESEIKAEMALSKQKDSLDQASKDSSLKPADNKPAVASAVATGSPVVNKTSPSNSASVRTTASSPSVPVVPVLRPVSSRFVAAKPAAKPISSGSIAPIAAKTVAAVLPSSSNPVSKAASSPRTSSLQAAVSLASNPPASSKARALSNSAPVNPGKKAGFAPEVLPARKAVNIALRPLAAPGADRSGSFTGFTAPKSVPNSFGNPATGSSESPVLVANATVPSEDSGVKGNVKTLSDYLGSKSAGDNVTPPPYNPSFVRSSPGLPNLADGLKVAQAGIAKPPLPAVSDIRPSSIASSSLPSSPSTNDSSGMLSLATGIRMVQDLPTNEQTFRIASSVVDDIAALEVISTRPSFNNAKLLALKSAKQDAESKSVKADKVESVKPLSNTFNIAKSILVGTSAKGSTLTPILWNGGASSSAKFIIKLDEAISDNSGQIALPSGSKLVVVAKAASNSLALADLEVVSVIIGNNEYAAPIGAISVRDDNNGLLVGDDYFRRNEQTANRDFLSVLTGAVSGVGQALNRPTNTFSFNGTGGSTTTSNQGRDLFGAALEGGFKDLPSAWAQRNQQALQEIASKPNVYQIPKDKAVRIFINKTIDF